MVQRNLGGDVVFEGVRKTEQGEVLEVYIWEKANFESHEIRHRISDAVALAEVEKAIFDPDVMTEGPPGSKRNFYRASAYIDKRNGRAVRVWRVHCFRQGRRFHIIATAFDAWSQVGNVIHHLETIVWKKPGSKI